jgi:F-type H+-transporting ATPase subunit c
MIQTLKIIITGVITGLKIGAGVGMGVVFGSRILSVYRNLSHPKERSQFFNYALLGFTYTEAAGLFALICLFILVYFSILFVFALLSTDQFIFTVADTSIQFIPFIQYSNPETSKHSPGLRPGRVKQAYTPPLQ